jgi:hypothetical protein
LRKFSTSESLIDRKIADRKMRAAHFPVDDLPVSCPGACDDTPYGDGGGEFAQRAYGAQIATCNRR